jgi:apolipoprotein N-acyltransferase
VIGRLLERRTPRVLAALASGVLLFFSLGLTPWWPAAWLAPVPLLAAAFRAEAWEARRLAWLAAAIGLSSNVTYYWRVTGLAMTVVLTILQILLWGFFVARTRAVVTLTRSWAGVFAFPALAAGLDTLVAAISPHGTWGSLAYTQVNVLPMIQIASVLGAAAVVFTVALGASTLAVAAHHGRRIEHPALAYGLPVLLIAGVLAYGVVRLREAPPEPTVKVGLAAVDDYIGPPVPQKHRDAVWARYDRLVGRLAAQGARIVVLPEKIGELDPAQARARRRELASLAKQGGVDLVAGVQLDQPGRDDRKYNASWLFGSNGALLAEYHKQQLVPGLEGDLVPGHESMVRRLDGVPFGLVICRDLLFPGVGRRYGRLGVAALLDPAWDFGRDAWMETATAILRGVESGYSVVRAGRDGYLDVSDRYGHTVARAPSASLPGRSLLADLPLGPARPTIYARYGDVFGWLCVVASALCLALPRRALGAAPSGG